MGSVTTIPSQPHAASEYLRLKGSPMLVLLKEIFVDLFNISLADHYVIVVESGLSVDTGETMVSSSTAPGICF